MSTCLNPMRYGIHLCQLCVSFCCVGRDRSREKAVSVREPLTRVIPCERDWPIRASMRVVGVKRRGDPRGQLAVKSLPVSVNSRLF